jgi:hypothetical protein
MSAGKLFFNVLWIEVLILLTVAKVGDSSDDIFELAVVMSDED